MLYIKHQDKNNLFIFDTDDNTTSKVSKSEYNHLVDLGVEIFNLSLEDSWEDNGDKYFTVSMGYRDFCVDVKYPGDNSNFSYCMDAVGGEIYKRGTDIGIRALYGEESGVILEFVDTYRKKNGI